MSLEQTLERLNTVKQAILDHKEQFNYGIWSATVEDLAKGQVMYDNKDHILMASDITTNCGTVGCVAGFTIGVMPKTSIQKYIKEKESREAYLDVFHLAMNWIGLNQDEARALFYGRALYLRNGISLETIQNLSDESITVDTAIERLDILIKYYTLLIEERTNRGMGTTKTTDSTIPN